MKKLSKKARTRGLAVLLSLLLMFSVVPVSVVQAEPETSTETGANQAKDGEQDDKSDKNDVKTGDQDKPANPEGDQGDEKTNPDQPGGSENGKEDETSNSNKPAAPDSGKGDETTTPDKPGNPDDETGEETTTPDKPAVPDDGKGDETTTPDKPGNPDDGTGEETTTPDKPTNSDGEEGDEVTDPDKPSNSDDKTGEEGTKPDKPINPDDESGDKIKNPADKTEQVTISGNGEDLRKPEDKTDVEVTDEVFFNTGSHVWQIVNEEAFTEGEIGDGCFEKDGSYTIHIPEPNPFFPYEVQFTYEDKEKNCWFMSPDDSVSIGGHTFYVSAEFDDSALISMNLSVGGDEIIVYPEEKEFTDDGDGISTYSLQPLEERNLQSIDLEGYTPAELTMVSVDYIFQNGEADNAENVVWTKTYDSNDNYTVSTKGDKLDLSWSIYSSSYNSWEMIVGSADQLDTANIRYYVPIRTTTAREWLLPTVYKKDQEGNRNDITVRSNEYRDYDRDGKERKLNIYLGSSQAEYDDQVYITLGVNSSVFPDTHYSKLEIFEGKFENAAEAQKNITEEICDSGYAMTVGWEYEQWVTIVTYDENGSVTGCLPVKLIIQSENDGNYVSVGWLYEKEGTSWGNDVCDSRSTSVIDGCVNYTMKLYTEYPVDNTYYLRNMTYYQAGESNPSAVTAVYVGQYNSIKQALDDGAVDIKDQLFAASAEGYAADYSKGVYFTVFVGDDGAEQEVYRYCIKAEAGTEPDRIPSSSTDVSFYGLIDKKNENRYVKTYRIQTGRYENDSYGDSNFCTFLVENTVDLEKLAPLFSTANGIRLHAGDKLQVSGETAHDFSKGAIEYTANAENEKDSRNYWLQVVPVNSGKRLYINSLADADADTREENGVIYSKREVLLDEYHGYRHDILLVNTGTEDIDNLGVELVSNTVELDEYWTLSGKNKLSAVTNVDEESSYGELSNLAKVRLKRKDGIQDGADVEGTLTIKSGSDVLMVLTLTGTVGNPRIITETIPNAVKYVPYGVMIQNNNKYRRNRVSYQRIEGNLPDGVEVTEAGELYGVPMEAGEYTFTVRMTNSVSSFYDSEKTYTLTVLDNTDTNVDSATDTGYDLTQRVVGADISGSGSQTLVSEGEYAQFQYVFLDGVKLTEGTDYTSEAGSTRITIRNQTLALSSGTHTIGIEFRTQDENNILNRAAQNYEIASPDDDDDHGSSSGDDTNGGNGSNTNNDDGSGTNEEADAVSTSGAGGSIPSSGQSNAGQAGVGAAGGIGNAGQTAAGLPPMLNAGTPVSYTIQNGDTLWTIAERHYGSGALWQKIYADNTATISNPDKIYAGQTIMIYPVQGEGLAGMAAAASTVADVSSVMGIPASTDGTVQAGTYYTVGAGDTLWKIARKVYGRGWQWRKIHKANEDQISDPSSLHIGQVIFIPE